MGVDGLKPGTVPVLGAWKLWQIFGDFFFLLKNAEDCKRSN